MNQEKFGVTKTGEAVFLYTFENENGLKMTVSNIGAVLTNLWVPDKEGIVRDVVLGFDTVEGYEANDDLYLGSTIGRNANRIANACFKLDGVVYQLAKNDGENNLHSGKAGYQLRVWDVKTVDEANNKITFSLISPDGDQGYPGELTLDVSYQLTENSIVITYQGSSSKDTVLNPTNHSYFNLNGHNSGTIVNHRLQLHASHFTPMKDGQAIPTGEILSVEQTPMDFRVEKPIGEEIDQAYSQLVYAKGYDHNFVLDNPTKGFACLTGDQSGIVMEATTNLPGVQFYTGNFMSHTLGKDAAVYRFREGLCLETQYFPNAVNEPQFQTPLLKKEEVVNYQTRYTFKVDK